MSQRQSGTTLGVGVLLSALLGLVGCGFGDLFRAAGPRDVSITFTGDSTIAVGTPSAFSVAVSANGATVVNPNLSIESSDTTVFGINATRDSLVALKSGNATLIIQLNDAVFTDSVPSIAVDIKVHGGP